MERRSLRLSKKTKAERKAAANIRIQQSSLASRVFPTFQLREPKTNPQNYIIEIKQPLLSEQSQAWRVPVRFGGQYRNRIVSENPILIIEQWPAVYNEWNDNWEAHDTPVLFKEFLQSLNQPVTPICGPGALVRITKPTEAEKAYPWAIVANIAKVSTLPHESADARIYDINFVDHTQFDHMPLCEIARNRKFELVMNPMHPTLLKPMKGGTVARNRIAVLADISPESSDMIYGLLMKGDMNELEFKSKCSESNARRGILISCGETLQTNGKKAYRGALTKNNNGRKLSVECGVISEAGFICVVKKVWLDITADEWIKDKTKYILNFGSDTDSLRRHWGTNVFRKPDNRGGYHFGDEVSFVFTHNGASDVGKLRMHFRVLYCDEFGIIHGLVEQ